MSGFNLSMIAVRERALTLLLILLIAAAGLFSFLQIGRAEDPHITIRKMIVTSVWPGATAEEMQNQVADRLEKRLQELDYLDHIETTTRPGVAITQVSIVGATPTARIADEWYQVRKKLADETPRLPRGVIGPFFNDEYSDVYFALFALQAKGMSERALVQEAERIRSRFLAVPGVGKVNILGERPQRVFVDFAPERLAALGIGPDQLINNVAGFNAVIQTGTVETGGPRIPLRLDTGFDDLDRIGAVPLSADGRTVKLADVAAVRWGYEDPASYQIRHQGEAALMLGVVMKLRYNGSQLGTDMARTFAAIKEAAPLGLELTQVFDQANVINDAFDEFMVKFAAAIAVVMLVTFATLGLRVGLVVAATVPLTLAAVFVAMLWTGKDFDNITLGALILSLGLLVDDAIIAIEMMVLKMEEGLDRVAAATFAWHSTAGPMLAGTLVAAAGFLPIGIARSTSGEYAQNIFWITAAALIMSWFVAVFFTPYLGFKLLPASKISRNHGLGDFVSRRRDDLRQVIGWCIDHKRRVLAYTGIAFIVAVAGLALLVSKQFFPVSDRPEVLVELRLPSGSGIEATSKAAADIERYLMRQPEALHVDTFIGAGAPRFFLSLNPEFPNPAFAKLVVQTKGPDARVALRDRLRGVVASGAFPAGRVRVTELLFGPPVPFPVTFRVSGPDPVKLRDIAGKVAGIVAADPDARGAHHDWGERSPALQLKFDNERLLALGLTPSDLGRQLGALVSGLPVSQARIGNRTVDVVIRARADGKLTPDAIGDLPIATRDGRQVTVAQVARLQPIFEDAVLIRRDRVPTISVVADIAEGAQPPDVTRRILSELENVKSELADGYSIETGGSVEESAVATASLVRGFPIMIAAMLLIIMLQVRSFPLMFLVVMTAPLGLIGAVLGLLITRYPFGFTAILGLIAIAGILMRNTLILVDQIGSDRAAGAAPYDAITEATTRRARPVILAALASLLAFVPLSLSSFWGPLAVVLIGGLVTGTALTLLVVPALYAVWFRVDRPEGYTAPVSAQPNRT